MPGAVGCRRSGGGRHVVEVGDGFPSLRPGVDVAPAQQPEGGLLIGRQVAGVDDVLDVGEPLAAPHASLDVQPHGLDRAHGSRPLAAAAEANPPREVLVADCELAVGVGDAVVGTAGVLRGRLLGGLARRERPLASVICACLSGAGGVRPRVGALVHVGLHGRFAIRHGGSQAAAGKAISAHTRVPTSRFTPQRRDTTSTRFSPKPPPCCRSVARRAIDPLQPRSSTSRRRTSAPTCARTLTTASAGASAWRTLLATSSTTSSCASASIVSVTCPAIQAPTATRAAAGASSAAASVTSNGPTRSPDIAPGDGASRGGGGPG